MLAKSWCNEHMLHRDYVESFNSCTREEWARWISTGRAGLQGFISIRQRSTYFWSRKSIEAELLRRGFSGGHYYPYVTSQFHLTIGILKRAIGTIGMPCLRRTREFGAVFASAFLPSRNHIGRRQKAREFLKQQRLGAPKRLSVICHLHGFFDCGKFRAFPTLVVFIIVRAIFFFVVLKQSHSWMWSHLLTRGWIVRNPGRC